MAPFCCPLEHLWPRPLPHHPQPTQSQLPKDSNTTMSPDQGDAIRRFATKDYLTRMEAALELGVSVKTLAKWASERKGPPFCKSANGTAYYQRKALLDWRSRQAVTLRYSFVAEVAA